MSKYCIAKDGPALYQECLECADRICERFHCLVVGSRGFNDYSLMCHKLDTFLANHKDPVIVSGGARGADTLAERYADERGLRKVVMKAEWDRYGEKAGYIRNREMHKYISRAKKRGVVAFWDGNSPGTRSNFSLAKEYGNDIRVVKY